MLQFDLCPECGVPTLLTREHLWLSNGDIVQKSNQFNRMAFIECENLDPMFANLGQIVGMSIDHLVIETAQRGIRAYLRMFISDLVRDRVLKGEIDIRAMDDAFRELARPLGMGCYEFVDLRFEQDENDYFTVSIEEAFSLLMCTAGHAGAVEAIVGYDHGVTCTEVSNGLHNITAFPSEHPKEYRERMRYDNYLQEPGDISLERCATCGGPRALSGYEWFIDRGVVRNIYSGKRMVMLGGGLLDPLFNELAYELGDTIPRAVVEAQRRFVKTGFYTIEEVGSEDEIREELALRGLGNLREVEIDKEGVRVELDNANLHLMVVGLIQGLYEMAFNVDSDVDWELSADGNLSVEVTPQLLLESVSSGY